MIRVIHPHPVRERNDPRSEREAAKDPPSDPADPQNERAVIRDAQRECENARRGNDPCVR